MSEDREVKNVVASKMRDMDLVYLANIVNAVGGSFGITLFLKGTVISGLMISGKEYYSTLAENLAQVGDIGENLAEHFARVADDVYTPVSESESIPANFIHMKDLRIKSGNGEFDEMHNALLRLKIEEIDGHIVGNVS
ncbi:gas vesicle protein [Pantoea alhagi]|uniref:gas vesicle protein n=1 Tax=Pantoea alhagi TaxID=1891675 RepID=UPI00202B3C49|nr:gas vesicle protein [Pantoea alhagi]URQ59501.1 gas vesicle protein [Pantoea alhagi]